MLRSLLRIMMTIKTKQRVKSGYISRIEKELGSGVKTVIFISVMMYKYGW